MRFANSGRAEPAGSDPPSGETTPAPPGAEPSIPAATGDWVSLHPAVIIVWRWGTVLNGVLLGAVGFGVLSLLADRASEGWLARLTLSVVGGAALGALVGLVAVPMRYRAWRYRFGPDALELQQGIWWRTVAAVPYQRIQQVEVEHGPLQRRLGMVSLSLRTAAAMPLGTIPGIDRLQAADIRRALLQRAGLDDGA